MGKGGKIGTIVIAKSIKYNLKKKKRKFCLAKKNLNNKTAFDPVISLLIIYPRKSETLIQKNIAMPVFIAVLFTIAKRKQPKGPSIDERGKKSVVHLHSKILLGDTDIDI